MEKNCKIYNHKKKQPTAYCANGRTGSQMTSSIWTIKNKSTRIHQPASLGAIQTYSKNKPE